MRERAPAKVNLCLYLGPTRSDGRHELVTVFDSVSLFDELQIADAAADEVVCEGVWDHNLVADALAGLRTAGWAAPPVRVVIRKRIPVAAGLGGGSADAAAMLRCAPRLAPLADRMLERIAATLGADVPSQLDPGPRLGTGAGEILAPLPGLAPYGLLVLPQPFPLATADVYREADRLGLARSGAELEQLAADLTARLPDRLVNDLQPAAVSLAPQIGAVIARAREGGADDAIVCGSGPTVIGVFRGADGVRRAERAAGSWGRGFPSLRSAQGSASPCRTTDKKSAICVRVGRPWPVRIGIRHNQGDSVSNQTVTYIVGAGCAVIVLGAFASARAGARDQCLPPPAAPCRRRRSVAVRAGRVRRDRRAAGRADHLRVATDLLAIHG